MSTERQSNRRIMRNRITDKRLEKAGFVLKEQPYETPDQVWVKDEVEIWDFNGEYWIVDALDQGNINVEFKTMAQLSRFWDACSMGSLSI